MKTQNNLSFWLKLQNSSKISLRLGRSLEKRISCNLHQVFRADVINIYSHYAINLFINLAYVLALRVSKKVGLCCRLHWRTTWRIRPDEVTWKYYQWGKLHFLDFSIFLSIIKRKSVFKKWSAVHISTGKALSILIFLMR